MRKLVYGKDFVEGSVLRAADTSACGKRAAGCWNDMLFVVASSVTAKELHDWLASGEAETSDGLTLEDEDRFFVARLADDGHVELYPVADVECRSQHCGNWWYSYDGEFGLVYDVSCPVPIFDEA